MAPSKVSANSLLDLLCTHVKWKRSGAGHTAAVPKMAQCLDSLIWLNLTTKLQFYLSMLGKKSTKEVEKEYFKRLVHSVLSGFSRQESFCSQGSENVLTLGCNWTDCASTYTM